MNFELHYKMDKDIIGNIKLQIIKWHDHIFRPEAPIINTMSERGTQREKKTGQTQVKMVKRNNVGFRQSRRLANKGKQQKSVEDHN